VIAPIAPVLTAAMPNHYHRLQPPTPVHSASLAKSLMFSSPARDIHRPIVAAAAIPNFAESLPER
jgi:hypothetical protein